MDNYRYDRGLETLDQLISKDMMSQTIEKVKEFNPDMARYVVEFAFGDIYSRPALDFKQREMLTITSLVTQGATSQLPFHIQGALRVGVTENEIVEVIIHCLPYVGFPKALGALEVVMGIFQERHGD